MNEQEFIDALKQLNIELTDNQLKQFNDYYQFLVQENKKYNLTAITEKEDVYLKHFYDCISIIEDFEFDDQSIIDVGAGAGFPSIPLKIIYPKLKITIVDSLNKRISFLNKLFQLLNLEDCKAIASRAEEYHDQADIVMARAVARLNILDELCLPLTKLNGHFLVLKGRDGLQEVKEASKGIEILGGEVIKENEFKLANGDTRVNIVIKKVKETPNKYPRNFGRIKKKPL